jgi:hypothetical protein
MTKLTISRLRRYLYRTSRSLGDAQAVAKNTAPKRAARRGGGKLAGKILRALLK